MSKKNTPQPVIPSPDAPELLPVCIYLPIFDWQLAVYCHKAGEENKIDNLSQNLDELDLEKESVNECIFIAVSDKSLGLTVGKVGPRKCIIVFCYETVHDFYLMLSHEVSHFVTNVLNSAGVDNEETFAYVTGYVFGALTDAGLLK